MLTILRNLLVLLALVVTASAATEENISRQLDVTSGGKLVVDVDFGTINVTAGVDDKVVIEAYRKIDFGDEAKEKEYFAAAPVVISQDGNVVTVRAHHTKSKEFWSFGHSEMDGRYTIRVPKRFETDLHTEGGDVTAGEVTGNATVKTSGGKLAFKHLEGTLTGEHERWLDRGRGLSRSDRHRNERRRHYRGGWNGYVGRQNVGRSDRCSQFFRRH